MSIGAACHRRRLAVLAALALALGACQSPVRAVRVDRPVAHRDVTRSAVTTGEPSWPTRDALLERGLLDPFEENPETALADLHRAMVAEGGAPELLFALAELSYLHGQEAKRREHQLAAAVYAYAFLFPGEDALRPGPFDPRFRIAADLYNWALTAGFASQDRSEFVPRADSVELPFGPIDVSFDPAQLQAGNRELYRLIPVTELEVHGLAMRYRRPGIGAPLAASTRPHEDGTAAAADLVAPRLQVPLTALLRIPEARRSLLEGRPLAATLELHLAWDEESLTIAGEPVPLESDPTAALALTFTGVPVAQIELFGFLGRLSGLMAERPPLVSTSPYRPGLVPVVFVHGTASSPVRWAELYNRLQADPEIRSRFQFWFFQYDSNRPIALSALRLREALSAAVALLDPQGQDPALGRMVLIGHSQGGLLVKMQSIDSGDQLWNAVSRKPLDELRLTDENRELIQRGMFVEPLPEVARVIFVATPHRGGAPVRLEPAAAPHHSARPAEPLVPRRRPQPGRRAEPLPGDGGGQHVAPTPVHPGPAGDPRGSVDRGALDHRGEGRRAPRRRQRRRRRVHERTHRGCRVRAGREVAALVPGEPAHDGGGAAHPAAARRAADRLRSVRGRFGTR
jgi:hypothetical protein